MEESKKKPNAISRMPAGFMGLSKPVMIGIAVACIVLALGITIIRSTGGNGGIEGLERGTMMMVKCANPTCGVIYDIDEVDYFLFLEEYEDEMDEDEDVAPAMECKECGKRSIYRAIKCKNEKCGEIFFANSVPESYEDTCPKCGFSEIEDLRRRAP